MVGQPVRGSKPSAARRLDAQVAYERSGRSKRCCGLRSPKPIPLYRADGRLPLHTLPFYDIRAVTGASTTSSALSPFSRVTTVMMGHAGDDCESSQEQPLQPLAEAQGSNGQKVSPTLSSRTAAGQLASTKAVCIESLIEPDRHWSFVIGAG